MKEYKINHRGHREKSLCSPKEFPLKDITEKIIACAIDPYESNEEKSRIIDNLQTELTG